MATPGNPTRPIFFLVLFGGLVALPAYWLPEESAPPDIRQSERAPARPSGLDAAPPEVRAFLGRVLDRMPEAGADVSAFSFQHWNESGNPTRSALGIKAVPGVEPEALIARVMDVDGYEGRIAHVDRSRSRPGPSSEAPGSSRFYQRIAVPGVARVQQEAVLVDAGTIKGYRVAYWYLLGPETEALDPKEGARSEQSVGAWLAAPGVVGYALSSWPRRGDVNAMQWFSLTTGADALAGRVVEGTIDGMADWARQPARVQSSPATRSTSTVLPSRRRTIATSRPLDQTSSSASGASGGGMTASGEENS